MFKASITISLRPSILDVQGKAVMHAVHSLGYENVDHLRIGKHVELTIRTADETKARQEVDEICKKILSNPVMENYSFTLEPVKETV